MAGQRKEKERYMKKVIVYIHGKGGNAGEAEHYKSIFPQFTVIGFDYRAKTPQEALAEFPPFFSALQKEYDAVQLIANSIGAWFAMIALHDLPLEKAYFISPVVEMEQLITDMMQWAKVTEDELREKGIIETNFGETLSWDYLCWVRAHPLHWYTPTAVLYGESDHLQPLDAITKFVHDTDAALTVMPRGEHWFHTPEQMAFLDAWLLGETAF